ncbi:MMPL family transporter [Streptosporangium soli]|nr:MMPL family transporter [Streptosporangium sp. KLBMP 9127]
MRLLTGRRTKYLVLLLWLAITLPLASQARNISDAMENNFSQFTPANAESSEVRDLLAAESGSQDLPAVVIYAREAGLTEADRAIAREDIPGRQLIPSDDGSALMVVVPIDATDEDAAYQTVKDLRERVHRDLPPGLDASVTGPAGHYVDSADAFVEADLTLLLVTLGVVAVFLLLIYRSPVLWLLPLLAVVLAAGTSQGVVYLLAMNTDLVVTGMGSGILTALVFGAGTDYALLLIARYREELRRQADRHAAMSTALRASLPAMAASAATVMFGVMCLVAADMRSSASLGPVAAIGILCAFLAMAVLLPILLLIFGRWIFWPRIPRPGDVGKAGVWGKVGDRVARRPRMVWIITVLAFAALGMGLTTAQVGIPGSEAYTSPPESITGQRLLSAHFPSGASAPADVITTVANRDGVAAIISATDGVSGIRPGNSLTDRVHLRVTLSDPPESAEAEQTIERLRAALGARPGTLVGGLTATQVDTTSAHVHDLWLVIPLVLLVIFIVLALLLRSLVAPLMLIGTVVLSFCAVLGLGWLIFDGLLGFGALGYDAILLGFVFLVALGVDYNIFLVSRIREETKATGEHRTGVLRGLALTGSVITGAGLVLAATFSALTVLPLVWAVQFGVIVAMGVLLDTFVVRSVMVPALLLDLGPRTWWPGVRAMRKTAPETPSLQKSLSGSHDRR